ncbi:MAG TPA: Nif3-like dinuclear metal center hexameric protein [Pirellulales bacterium]|jgi:dinuclear metal center YbgI/SA1388 family protein|nr:Nif3-like dinuclear metal center hexameric protein [Pirellulales bacterium]
MLTVAMIADYLEHFAPPRLAEEWDNVGLLVGNAARPVERMMTCLTLTPDSVGEAVAEQADLVVTHHPLPFRPLRRVTSDSPEGRLLLDLIEARIAVYSPHTAFDSTGRGVNQRLAEGIGLDAIEPLVAGAYDPAIGTGRCGKLAEPLKLAELAERTGRFVSIETVQFVGDPDRAINKVAVGCGSAGELLAIARDLHCACFVTGEARFHSCLEAEASGIALILVGHFASERFALEQLAELLASQFPSVVVWASRRERDPLRSVQTNCPS